MRKTRMISGTALTVVAGLVAAGAAHAQAVATATPNLAGQSTRLHWAVDGTQPPFGGQIPTSLTMSAPPGFTLNSAALTKRCKTIQAKLDECPAASRIGSASLTIHIDKPGGPRDLPVPIKLYLGSGTRLLAVAFLAGVHVVPGSISGTNGITVSFNPLPVPPPIPTVSYAFNGATLDVGGTVTVMHKVKRKAKKGRKPKSRTVKTRVALVKAPTTCPAGGWMFTTSSGLPDGTAPAFTTPVACSG